MALKDIDVALVKQRAAVLSDAGFRLASDNSYAIEFRASHGNVFYLKKTKKLSIALDPAKYVSGQSISGIVGKEGFNRSFYEFPSKVNNGEGPEHFGISFDISNEGDLIPFLTLALKGAL